MNTGFPETDFSPLITQERVDGNCFYLNLREYESGDACLSVIRLNPDDNLRKGGGSKRKNTTKDEMDEEILVKSRRRTKKIVKERCLQLCPDHMLTMTFQENVTDLDEAWRVFKRFSGYCKKKYPGRWAYVAVPELQKRGAVHFHLAVKGFYVANTLRRLWRKAAGKYGGNIHLSDSRKYGASRWNIKKICGYMTKYITKGDIVKFNKKRFSSGGNIPPVTRSTGYIALGLPMVKLADDMLRRATRKQVAQFYEGDSYFQYMYFET